MPGSQTTPGRLGARISAPARFAFRHTNGVGTQRIAIFEAQWLAYTHPCQRFVMCLTARPHA